jgi:hypothetical protein
MLIGAIDAEATATRAGARSGVVGIALRASAWITSAVVSTRPA